MSNPLSEVFGFPITNESSQAKRYREKRLCPYHNVVPSCTKTRADDPLGVCSVYHRNEPIITCPVRFREDWLIVDAAADFFFESGVKWTSLGEVRLKNKQGGPIGNIDYVLVAYDDVGRVLDFGSLEVQAVYISGNLGGPFKTYMEQPRPDFDWSGALNYPTPDYLSSSRKRLAPQLVAKGGVMRLWGKKQAVAIQTAFYNTLPPLPEVDRSQADLAWYLYDLVYNSGDQRMHLQLNRIVYTEYESALLSLSNNEPADVESFVAVLQRKLDSKFAGNIDSTTPFLGDTDGSPATE